MKAEKAEPTSYKERSSLTTLIISRILVGKYDLSFLPYQLPPWVDLCSLNWTKFHLIPHRHIVLVKDHISFTGFELHRWLFSCLCQLREMKSSGATSVFGSECRFENTVRIINVDKDIQNTGVTNWTACFLLLHVPGLNETMSFWFSAVLNFLWLKPMSGSKCSKNLSWISI